MKKAALILPVYHRRRDVPQGAAERAGHRRHRGHRRRLRALSRGLYINAKRDSFKRAEVRSFIGFAMNNQAKVARAADFVALTPAQARRARYHYNTVLRQVK